MAKSELPDYAAKQKLLYGKDPKPEAQIATGEAFFAAGQLYDALLCFHQAQHTAGLERVRVRAVAEADPLLLKLVLAKLETAAATEEWRRLGQAAMDLGKRRNAEEAYRMAGEWGLVAQLRGETVAEERAASDAGDGADDGDAEPGEGDAGDE